MKKTLIGLVVVGFVVAVAAVQAVPIWEDDFEAYPIANPADFSLTGNWTWNGAGGGTGHDSRLFATGNFGGSQLWICHPDALGSGITSAGIVVDPDTDYAFVGNLVAETFAGARDNEFAVDLLIGPDVGSALSVVGGPVTVIGRGDGGDGVPADAIDDSYEDQITTIPFNSGVVGAGDRLFIEIVYVGPGPSANPGFTGVDNIAVIPEPATLVLLGLGGLLMLRRRKH